jgi:hypothetical protein
MFNPDPTIVWEGKKFPCREALARIKEILAFKVDLTKGKYVRKEVAITFSPQTGYYVVYETTVNRSHEGDALEDGFVARKGFRNGA